MPIPADVPAPAPMQRRRRHPVIATIAGVVAALFMTAGGAALYADGQKDADGWFSTDTAHFATASSALATENLDLDLGGQGDLLFSGGRAGDARVQATSADGTPLFVGIARTKDVERYLAGTSHAMLTDIDTSPFRADIRTANGDAAPADPAAQGFWAASTSGGGTQSLEWEIADGDWSAVVMNADGSAGVDVQASAGVDAGFLQPIGYVLLGGALVFSLLGAAVVLRARRV
jgi:hypothetical protein